MQNGDAENNTTTKTEEWILDGSSTTQSMGVSRLRSPWQFSQEKGVVAADDLVRGGNWCRECSATAYFAEIQHPMRIADGSDPDFFEMSARRLFDAYRRRIGSCVTTLFYVLAESILRVHLILRWKNFYMLRLLYVNKHPRKEKMSLEYKDLHH